MPGNVSDLLEGKVLRERYLKVNVLIRSKLLEIIVHSVLTDHVIISHDLQTPPTFVYVHSM